MSHFAGTTFTAIHAIAISFKFTPPAFKGAQADIGHITGTRRWLAFRDLRAVGLPLFLQHQQGRHLRQGLLLALQFLF